MKTYVVIFAVAATALAVAALLLQRDTTAPAAADVPSAAPTPAASDGAFAAPPPRRSPGTSAPRADAPAPERVTSASAATTDLTATAPEDWDAPCECAEAWAAQRQERQAAAREAEAKDVGWAYETEQLLQQYILTDPRAGAIQLSGIDCRTTYCEIEAVVPANASRTLLEVIKSAQEEPWNTLGGGLDLDATPTTDGQEEVHTFIARASAAAAASVSMAPTWSASSSDAQSCPCATPEWMMRRALHDATLRAAEPKDIDWAYAMEQRLQQYIAARPAATSFEVSSIDCRTTYCEIKVVALTEQARASFDDIIGEATADEAFGLESGRASSYARGEERIEMTTRITRKR